MIKVIYKTKNDFISEVKVSGHANFANHGNDIVCASVSSIVTTTVNAIIRFDENAIDYTDAEGLVVINVNVNTDQTEVLLTNMIELFKELEKQYKNNIKVN